MKGLFSKLLDVIIILASAFLVAGIVNQFLAEAWVLISCFLGTIGLWIMAMWLFRSSQAAKVKGDASYYSEATLYEAAVLVEPVGVSVPEELPPPAADFGSRIAGTYLANPRSTWSDSDGDHHSHGHHFYLLLEADGKAWSSPLFPPEPGDGAAVYISGQWTARLDEEAGDVMMELLLKRNAAEPYEPLFEIANEDRRNMKYGGSLVDAGDYFDTGYYIGKINLAGEIRIMGQIYRPVN